MSRKPRGTTPDVTLTDTGPLVALFDADDKFHVQAEQALARLPRRPLLTTWPCLTESMYLLHQSIGHAAQEELWGWVADGLLQLHLSSEGEWRRMRGLMAQYIDSPMDLADASLVAAAEALSLTRVFTILRRSSFDMSCIRRVSESDGFFEAEGAVFIVAVWAFPPVLSSAL